MEVIDSYVPVEDVPAVFGAARVVCLPYVMINQSGVGNLAMTWDHRAFDGAYAAGFLVRVKEILETRDWNTEL